MVSAVRIGDRNVGPGEVCYIIAEAGVNHNGDLKLAKQLVDVAVEAKADAVKFQTFKAERVARADAPKAEYQEQTTGRAESQLEMIKSFELPPEAFGALQSHCRHRGITFLSTPYDHESVDLLDSLGVPAFKIASAEMVNLPMLRYIARKGRPIFMSTGMSDLGEVESSVRAVWSCGNRQLVLLHCVSNYPAKLEEVNLRAMGTLAQAFQVPVGYSDHTLGIEVALASAALGACVIEKHFTLDRAMPGPDHRASLDPAGLAAMVAGIRTVELAMGNGIKTPADSEKANQAVMRRGLYARRSLNPGEVLQEEDLIALRPAKGLSPQFIDQIAGRKLRRRLSSGSPLTWSDLE